MTVRTIPRGLASLLELLELEQSRVVTAAEIEVLAAQAGLTWPAPVVVRRLREHGWLLPLAARGVWEFAPAARAGALGAGDPFVELRAVLARDPNAPFVVAAESAAFMLGLSGRRPDPECVSAPPGVRPPQALRGLRLVRWEHRVSPVSRDQLPVWAVSTLLAFMATRPAGFHDWPNVREWLAEAATRVDAEGLISELEGRSAGPWARAAYLLDLGGAAGIAVELARRAPAGEGPHYLGGRGAPGRHSRAYDVVDTLGLWRGIP